MTSSVTSTPYYTIITVSVNNDTISNTLIILGSSIVVLVSIIFIVLLGILCKKYCINMTIYNDLESDKKALSIVVPVEEKKRGKSTKEAILYLNSVINGSNSPV